MTKHTTKNRTRPACAGSKKALVTQPVNTTILADTPKRTLFEQVAAGICPHDEGYAITASTH